MSKVDLLRVFLRGFWVQASWSFEGMQSLGFAFAMEPALKRLYPRREELQRALARHLEFFNTHPFLAFAVLGCAVRLEEAGGDRAEQEVRRVKNALMGPYGAVGDSFYWGAVKPLLLILALHAAFRGMLWAPWVFAGAFLFVGVGGRTYGFIQGYRHGVEVVQVVGRLGLLRWASRLKAWCAVLLGTLVAGLSLPTLLSSWEVSPRYWIPSAAVLVVILARLMGAGVRPEWVVGGSAAMAAMLVLLT